MIKGLPNANGKAKRVFLTVKGESQIIARRNVPPKESHCITSEGRSHIAAAEQVSRHILRSNSRT